MPGSWWTEPPSILTGIVSGDYRQRPSAALPVPPPALTLVDPASGGGSTAYAPVALAVSGCRPCDGDLSG
ncbi:hypothetical protein D5R93_10250 [Actinomyces lilanjuaniae]|uniref:Uncharacterized protein n=1 Tax=Actinomyces lilanjuaniae TaxID=2321394 RepID=A0ABM6Z4P6_9ACTO|nr:hypothetical protein D5R93_10250 [Actinomyces lilanjuaniae]